MATVSAFEAKTHFGELPDRVSKGEEVVQRSRQIGRPAASRSAGGVERAEERVRLRRD